MKLLNNAKETSFTVGAGVLALEGAVAGHQSLEAAGGYGSPFVYRIDGPAGAFEIGVGSVLDNATETGFELHRDIILMTSAPGEPAALVLPSGKKTVAAVDLAMFGIVQNVLDDGSGVAAEATGSGAIAAGLSSYATGDEAIAFGVGAGATHDGSIVLGRTYSRGRGLFCAGSRRDDLANGPLSFFGESVQAFMGSLGGGSVAVARLPEAAVGIVAGRCELVMQDSTDGNYVGALRWLLIAGETPTLIVTEALTAIHSTRASPPSVSLSLTGPTAGEYAVVFGISGGIAERFLLKTEMYGSP